jgi:DNA polymerase-3 subunit epsilon
MDFIAFDLETTGIRPESACIVEIGAVRFNGGTPGETFGMLIDPGIPMPPEASAVNGITDDMLRGKPPVSEVLEAFSRFCGTTPLVAHNAPFDFKFLCAFIEKCRTAAPQGPVMDSLPLARKVFPGLPNYKLGTLIRHLQIPSGNFHRAEEDSLYCGLVFEEMLRRLRTLGEDTAPEALAKFYGKKLLQFPKPPADAGQLDLF